jgi:FtsZ-interacting cell division protein ZipA
MLVVVKVVGAGAWGTFSTMVVGQAFRLTTGELTISSLIVGLVSAVATALISSWGRRKERSVMKDFIELERVTREVEHLKQENKELKELVDRLTPQENGDDDAK